MYVIDPIKACGFGALSLGAGLWIFLQKRRRLKTWIRVTATVSNVRRDENGNAVARFQYVDQAGAARACSLPVEDGNCIGLGSEMPVAYNPANPDEAFVADKKDMNLGAIGAIVLGGGLIAVGIWSATVLGGFWVE